MFVDDNPFERQSCAANCRWSRCRNCRRTRRCTPRCLADAGYFEGLRLSPHEDLERAGQYQANSTREALRPPPPTCRSYLRSLDMRLQWSRFDRVGQPRIVQLINKTNQFNLTTRRYRTNDVLALIADATRADPAAPAA